MSSPRSGVRDFTPRTIDDHNDGSRHRDRSENKFYGWRERYGKVNEHNGRVSRNFWLENWEKQPIIAFHPKNPPEGYRRLTLMMLAPHIVAVSPASLWRALSAGNLRLRSRRTPFASLRTPSVGVPSRCTGPRSALLPPNAASEWRPSLPTRSASVAFSCVRSLS